MNLLAEFWNYPLANRMAYAVDQDNTEFVEDDSEFVCVDGEEGDYGVIKYLDTAGNLVAIRTIYGGDREDVDFTEFGKALMRQKLTALLETVLAQD